MYALQTIDGKPVLLRSVGSGYSLSSCDLVLRPDVPGDLEVVSEAVVVKLKKGQEPLSHPSKEWLTGLKDRMGLSDFELSEAHHGGCTLLWNSHRSDAGACRMFSFTREKDRTYTYTINGQPASKELYEKAKEFTRQIDRLSGLHYDFGDRLADLSAQSVLEIIGEGNTVTAESLSEGCAKGESCIRLKAGDTVSFKSRGKVLSGVLSVMGKKAVIIKPDGKKSNISYSSVWKDDSAETYDEERADALDITIKESMAEVMARGVFYRAPAERLSVGFPLFPIEGERGEPSEERITCKCPLCAFPMAEFKTGWRRQEGEGKFTCSYCKATGIIVDVSEEEVSLLMMRKPSKNQFCIEEARCCGNCGLFEFEYGRQGKRSTGYCKTTNQCVQAFNTCDYWYPRSPKNYNKSLTQHMTNLGYSPTDSRNEGRVDSLEDTVYTEEDHEKEKVRASEAKETYQVAYSKFMDDLKKRAKDAPLTRTLDEAGRKAWMEALEPAHRKISGDS